MRFLANFNTSTPSETVAALSRELAETRAQHEAMLARMDDPDASNDEVDLCIVLNSSVNAINAILRGIDVRTRN